MTSYQNYTRESEEENTWIPKNCSQKAVQWIILLCPFWETMFAGLMQSQEASFQFHLTKLNQRDNRSRCSKYMYHVQTLICQFILSNFLFQSNTEPDQGSIRSSPRYVKVLLIDWQLGTELDGSITFFFIHGRPAFWPSRTKFVYPGCWHFGNATHKIDDVLTEHSGLLHVLPLDVFLPCWRTSGGNILKLTKLGFSLGGLDNFQLCSYVARSSWGTCF